MGFNLLQPSGLRAPALMPDMAHQNGIRWKTIVNHPNPSRTGQIFAFVALTEAMTWAGLLIGMFLKYVTATTTLGVWLFGRLHGAAFILYVVITVIAAWRLRWPWWSAILALLAAIPPLVTLPLERWFKHRGLLIAAHQRSAYRSSVDSARSS